MFTASEVFDLAIQVEVNGERFYRYALSRNIRKELKDLLSWLADQEMEHGENFQDMKKRICGSSSDTCEPVFDLSTTVLRSAMGRHAFSLEELDVFTIEEERELLELAIEFEKDTILFYEFIASLITDPQALLAIDQIRRQEIDHKRLLMENLAKAQSS